LILCTGIQRPPQLFACCIVPAFIFLAADVIVSDEQSEGVKLLCEEGSIQQPLQLHFGAVAAVVVAVLLVLFSCCSSNCAAVAADAAAVASDEQ
jgi:hypothetical protein